MANGANMIPLPTSDAAPVAGRVSVVSDASAWDATVTLAVSRLRWRDGAAHADGNRPDLPPTFARDAGAACGAYLRAVAARAESDGITGASLRASDAGAYVRAVAARVDTSVITDGRRAGKTARVLSARAESVRGAVAGAIPSEAYGAERFDPSLARALRLNASDARLASRHGAARKSDGARPIPRDHFAAPVACSTSGARILHLDPVAVGPTSGAARADTRAESDARRAADLDRLLQYAPTVKANDRASVARLAGAVTALRASGLGSREAHVFASMRHGTRKAVNAALA